MRWRDEREREGADYGEQRETQTRRLRERERERERADYGEQRETQKRRLRERAQEAQRFALS